MTDKTNKTSYNLGTKDSISDHDISDEEKNVGIELRRTISDDTTETSVFNEDKVRLSKGLGQRHIQMISLVGVFGTGLFVSSGGTLAKAGPVGMLLSFVIIAVIVSLNQIGIAETAALMPVTGATVRHSEFFLDPAFGFAYGYLSVYSSIIPTEITAVPVLISYWSDISPAVWITVAAVPIVVSNCISVRFYGEIEFVFALLKIALIIGLIIGGLCIDLGGVKGQERLGFHYWRDPGPFAEYIKTGSLGKFLGFWGVLTSTVYSFGGVQTIALLAGETSNARYNIPVAAKRVIYRVVALYLLTVFVLTLIVPYNDKKIATGSGNAASSPFVIAFQRAGVKAVPSIINAVVLTSAWSAANLSLLEGSRNLFSLAAKGLAPKIFLKTNKFGLPYIGVIFSAFFIPLAYMSVSSKSANVFNWFQNMTSSKLLIQWMLIAANHVALHRALKVQGYSKKDLPFNYKLGPLPGWISGIASFLIFITAGFKVFIHGFWNFETFFSSYFTLVLFGVLYLGWKIFKKTKFVRSSDVDLKTLFEDAEKNPAIIPPPMKKWQYINLLWS